MSSPDPILEKGYWLQDNLADYLWNADREELAEFVEKMMPHISNIGVRVIYPLVSEVYPPRSTPTYGMVAMEPDDDEIRLNHLRSNPEKEGTNGD